MQVQTKHSSDTTIQLEITADAETLSDIKNQTLQALRGQVKLQGFRQGKTPLSMVERSLDPNTLQSEFLENAINRLYVDAISQENVRPVAQPKVDLKKFVPFSTLEISVEVEVIGQITLPDYKKITIAKPAVTVAAKDITAVLENLRDRTAERKEVSRAAKAGDEVTIDFAGPDVKTKEAVKGGDGKDYPLLLGSDSFIPGFEDNVVGLKAGQDKTFVITFPKDYGVKALQNRDVSFAVTVKKVAEIVKPKLDDAFAATVGPFKTLAELKADIKKQLIEEKQTQADRDYENELITSLTKKTKLSVPAAIVDEELEGLERDERQNLAYRGQTWQEHLDEEGVTEAEHRNRNRAPAEDRVKAGLMLSEIAAQEKITVSEEEIDERLQLLKGQYSDEAMRSELDKPDNRRSIASQIMTEKTIAKLKSFAA